MPETSTATRDDNLAHLILIREIEDFLYLEADLLDERRYDEWLPLLADDLKYWMPIRLNLPFRQRDQDITSENDASWFDDDKVTVTKRVRQIMTGIHWAEEPLSRVTHLISNVRLTSGAPGDPEFSVRSHFLVHRNRLEDETDFLTGRREDVLRRNGSSFLVARRKIIIDQDAAGPGARRLSQIIREQVTAACPGS